MGFLHALCDCGIKLIAFEVYKLPADKRAHSICGTKKAQDISTHALFDRLFQRGIRKCFVVETQSRVKCDHIEIIARPGSSGIPIGPGYPDGAEASVLVQTRHSASPGPIVPVASSLVSVYQTLEIMRARLTDLISTDILPRSWQVLLSCR